VAVSVVLLLYFAQHTRAVEGYTHKASRDALFGLRADPDWIDDTIGRDANVGTLFYSGNPIYVWENEFFNHGVGMAYTLPGLFDGLPEVRVSPRASGVVVDADGRPQYVDYVLASRSLVLRAERVSADRGAATVLYRTRGPVALQALIDGLYPDTWSGPSVRYLRWACKPGVVTVRLTNELTLRRVPVTVSAVATAGGRTLASAIVPRRAVGYPLRVPLVPAAGMCDVTFTITPTQVPDNGDPRELGIRFASVRYRARGA
jgi:hypothetical protein